MSGRSPVSESGVPSKTRLTHNKLDRGWGPLKPDASASTISPRRLVGNLPASPDLAMFPDAVGGFARSIGRGGVLDESTTWVGDRGGRPGDRLRQRCLGGSGPAQDDARLFAISGEDSRDHRVDQARQPAGRLDGRGQGVRVPQGRQGVSLRHRRQEVRGAQRRVNRRKFPPRMAGDAGEEGQDVASNTRRSPRPMARSRRLTATGTSGSATPTAFSSWPSPPTGPRRTGSRTARRAGSTARSWTRTPRSGGRPTARSSPITGSTRARSTTTTFSSTRAGSRTGSRSSPIPRRARTTRSPTSSSMTSSPRRRSRSTSATASRSTTMSSAITSTA